MTDSAVQVEPQRENSPSGRRASGGPQQREGTSELHGPVSLLADVAPAPPGGEHAARSCPEVASMERSLHSMQLQLQFLTSKADDLRDRLVNGQGHRDRDTLAAAVPSFLCTCVPYFNLLESKARSTTSQHTPLPCGIYSKLLDFSQQLCDKLEQLVLTYEGHGLLCLDESEPNSMSHFCIGQSQHGRLRLTVFRYPKPAPYLARVDTGLYKRMRWNVQRLRDEQQQADEEREAETVEDTEYYFLCYEDIPQADTEAGSGSQGPPCGQSLRMWSIGQWVQANPDTEDIYDWIACEVPQASYRRLLFLGSDEPSSRSATYDLQQLLLSQQAAE